MQGKRQVDPETYLDILGRATESDLRFTTCSPGRVTGWRSGSRVIEDTVIWYIHRGEIHGKIDEKEVVIPTGCFSWISSLVPHDLQLRSARDVLRNHVVRFQLWAEGELIVPDWNWRGLMGFARGDLLLEQLSHAALQPARFRFQEMRALLLCLTAEAVTHQEHSAADANAPVFTERKMNELVGRLAEQWKSGMRPADMAVHFGLSTDYFARKFREQFGISPRDWLTEQRLRYAAMMLLESGLRVQEIAFELGFTDPQFFSRHFKRHYGMTPMQYRRKGNWRSG